MKWYDDLRPEQQKIVRDLLCNVLVEGQDLQ